jgi:aldehyde:ferredoxin oxidoreductase
MGCLNFSWYDPKRGAVRLKQAGRGGTGTVFRDKKLKALVIRSPKMGPNLNNAADLPSVIKVGRVINQEIHDHDDEQCHMRRQGTAHLVEVMDAYDLLPVHNFQYGKHPDTPKIDSQVWDKRSPTAAGTAAAWPARRAPTAMSFARARTRATS